MSISVWLKCHIECGAGLEENSNSLGYSKYGKKHTSEIFIFINDNMLRLKIASTSCKCISDLKCHLYCSFIYFRLFHLDIQCPLLEFARIHLIERLFDRYSQWALFALIQERMRRQQQLLDAANKCQDDEKKKTIENHV